MARYLVTLCAEVDNEAAAIAAANAHFRCEGLQARPLTIEEALRVLLTSHGAPDGARLVTAWCGCADTCDVD